VLPRRLPETGVTWRAAPVAGAFGRNHTWIAGRISDRTLWKETPYAPYRASLDGRRLLGFCPLSVRLYCPGWNLILEEREDETFAVPCPGESGSDDIFPYHHFILSNHHRQLGDSMVIRFCVRCGLSHHLGWTFPNALGIEVPYPLNINMRAPIWQHIKENERDTTVSDLCPVEQGSDASKRRYLLVPKN